MSEAAEYVCKRWLLHCDATYDGECTRRYARDQVPHFDMESSAKSKLPLKRSSHVQVRFSSQGLPMPLLFSYGTLQQEAVQLATFARKLTGHPDELIGFESSLVKIDDPAVVASSGKTHHPIVKFTGASHDRVAGTVFEITDAELAAADRYEVAAYRRVAAQLGSGLHAWVYVDARFAPTDT